MIYFLGAAVVVALLAAVIDWRTGEIPNWLTLGPLLGGVIGHTAYDAAHGASASDAVQSGGAALFGALACAVIPLILYRQDAIGGGDVKLLAGLGAILGWRNGLEAEVLFLCRWAPRPGPPRLRGQALPHAEEHCPARHQPSSTEEEAPADRAHPSDVVPLRTPHLPRHLRGGVHPLEKMNAIPAT